MKLANDSRKKFVIAGFFLRCILKVLDQKFLLLKYIHPMKFNITKLLLMIYFVVCFERVGVRETTRITHLIKVLRD